MSLCKALHAGVRPTASQSIMLMIASTGNLAHTLLELFFMPLGFSSET
jgi:hypothetical protein